MIFKNSKVYDTLKWLAAPGLPALSTCLIAIGKIIGNETLSLIGAILVPIAAMLGEWTHVSSKKYWAAQQDGGDYSEEPAESEDYSEEPEEGTDDQNEEE